MQSIDPIKQSGPNLLPPRPRESRAAAGPQRQKTSAALPQTGARFTKLKPAKKKHRRRDMLIAALVSPVLLGLSIIGVIGMGIVVIYALVAIVRRFDSRVSFVLALAAFVYMFALQLAVQPAWAQTEAVFAYILLTTGAISLALETRHSRGMWSRQQ